VSECAGYLSLSFEVLLKLEQAQPRALRSAEFLNSFRRSYIKLMRARENILVIYCSYRYNVCTLVNVVVVITGKIYLNLGG
jgi:hypothetical protein